MIGLGRRDHARLAPALGHAFDRAHHPRRRREISCDQIELLRLGEIPAERARPRVQPPRRAAEQPAGLATLGIAPVAERAPEVAQSRLGTVRPPRQRIEIADQALGGGPFDPDAEIAPAFRVVEIAVFDVEAADNRLPLIGKRELLVIAQ